MWLLGDAADGLGQAEAGGGLIFSLISGSAAVGSGICIDAAAAAGIAEAADSLGQDEAEGRTA